MNEKRKISLQRADELQSRIDDFLEARQNIPKGLELDELLKERKEKVLSVLGGTEEDWNNYKWQLSNRIADTETLGKIVNLSSKEIEEINEVGKWFRWAI